MRKRERTGVICLSDGCLLAIELEDPASREKFWSFPGGLIEAGETPAQAAVRETTEETGYTVVLQGSAFVNQYLFNWNDEVFDCTTHWYLARLATRDKGEVDDAAYILGSAWLEWPACRGRFTYNDGLTSALDHFL